MDTLCRESYNRVCLCTVCRDMLPLWRSVSLRLSARAEASEERMHWAGMFLSKIEGVE